MIIQKKEWVAPTLSALDVDQTLVGVNPTVAESTPFTAPTTPPTTLPGGS